MDVWFEKIAGSEKFTYLKSMPKPKVGWFSVSVPEEIFSAAGLLPFRITGDMADNTNQAVAALSNNYCSYVLSCLSEGLDNVYEFVDGVVFSDACDMRKRMYEVWVKNAKTEYHFFYEMSKAFSQTGRDYFQSQMKELVQSLRTHFNCEITNDQLRSAIALHNKTRRLLQRVYELRKKGEYCLSGKEVSAIIKAATVVDKEEFNARLSLLLDGIKPSPKQTKPLRVLFTGSYFDNPKIIEVIENSGAVIVCEDLSNGVKYLEGQIAEEGDPLGAISDYYYFKSSCARIIDTDTRIDHMLKLVHEYSADVVIYFSLKFCDTNLIDFPYVQLRLNQENIPVLFVEGEHHSINIENLKTRIETFIQTRLY